MTLLTEPPVATAPSSAAKPPAAVLPTTPLTHDATNWTEATDEALYELVDGKRVEKNVSAYTLWTATELASRLSVWARERRAGFVILEQPLLGIFGRPDRGRRPDVCFVSRATLPELPATGDLRVAPDLVIEVVSPNDLAEPFETKLMEYTQAGVKLIWAVFPTIKHVRVHRPDGTARMLNITAALEDEAVLPGFRLPLADLFATP